MAAGQQSLLSFAAAPPQPLASFTFGASNSAFTLAWPSGHQAGDVGVLFIETANEALATPAGWTPLFTPTGTGTGGTATATRLYAFAKVATSSSEADASITDSGAEQQATMNVLRGVDTSGGVAGMLDGENDNTAVSGTGVTVPSVSTSGPNRYVIGAAASAGNLGAPSNACMAWTPNGNLDNFVELADYGTVTALLGVFGGVKAVAGSVGATAGTFSAAGVQEKVCLAFKPG